MTMTWRSVITDLLIVFIVIFLNFVDKSLQIRNHHDRWEHISIRYGFWYNLPPYQPRAFKEGYTRKNDVCKTENYHGFLFAKDGNTKVMPIYDLNGNLAGIQSAIPGNMRGYNSLNETIDLPPIEIMPPVLKGLRDKNGILYYTVTAYFKHPQLICSPITSKGVNPGRGLYIQMGFNTENDFLHIPRESKHLTPLWRRGNCVPMMGTHYFMNMSVHLPCEKIYPVFLMYNAEGKLSAFGWVFQGRPNNIYSDNGVGWFHLTPDTYPFLYDTKMLPPCMLNENFRVFGIHVYFEDPNKLLCVDAKQNSRHDTTNKPRTKEPPPKIITANDNDKTINRISENYAIDTLNDKSTATKLLCINSSTVLLYILHVGSVFYLTRQCH